MDGGHRDRAGSERPLPRARAGRARLIAAALLLGVIGAASETVAAPIPRAPEVLLQRTLPVDSGRVDVAASVLPIESGALIVGWTSRGAEPPDALLIRVSAAGDVEWRRHLGGAGADLAFAIRPQGRGGYVLAGFTSSQGDGGSDGWVFGVDSAGIQTWERTFGGPEDERLTSLAPASSGWIAAGQTSRSGDVEAWVVRLDAGGARVGEWTWGGPGTQRALSVAAMDEGCVIAGRIGEGRGEVDGFVTRLDGRGRQVWTRSVGGRGFHVAYQVRRDDRGFVITGYGDAGPGNDHDAYALRIREDGGVGRRVSFGGPDTERATQSVEVADGSVVVVGYSKPRTEREDAPRWTLTLWAMDPGGRPTWSTRIGDPGRESGHGIAQGRDGLWVVGQSATRDGGSAVLVARLSTMVP